MKYLPAKKDLEKAVIDVLNETNGTATVAEINDLVSKRLNISKEAMEIEDASGMSTEYEYQMRWTRTKLKKDGIIENVSRGVWRLVK